jgi:hypothetical protein
MSPKREAGSTTLAVAIGATGVLAVVYPHAWYYGVGFIALLFAWIVTAAGAPGVNDPAHRWMP